MWIIDILIDAAEAAWDWYEERRNKKRGTR